MHKANALRTAGLPFTFVDDKVRNLYTLHIQNKTDGERVYSLAAAAESLAAHPELELIIPQSRIRLESFDDTEVPIFADVWRVDYSGGFAIEFEVSDMASGESRRIAVRFLGP